MGFIKNFKRDFAQAVNELLPEGEEKNSKKKKEVRQEIQEPVTSVPAEELPLQEEYRDPNVQDAVSEAILREEADQLREEILQNTEQRMEQMSRELDEEIDSYPEVPSEDSADANVYVAGAGYEEPAVYNMDAYGDETVVPDGDEASVEAYASDSEIRDISEEADAEAVAMQEIVGEIPASQEEAVLQETPEEWAEDAEWQDESGEEPEEEVPEDAGQDAEEEPEEDEEETSEDVTEEETSEILTKQESEVSRLAELEAQAGLDEAISGLAADCTYITAKTKIQGDIETEGDIDLIGTVNGNINCQGKLIVGGTVMGEIRAGELYANQAKIEGPIMVTNSVKIGVGSVIIGKITATSAVIAGAVNGDIDVQGPVIVDSSAVIVGNIKSKSVQINNGAIIEGFCSQAYLDVDVKKYFATDDSRVDTGDAKIEELMPESQTEDVKEAVSDKLSKEEEGHQGGSNRNRNRNRNHSGNK